jgi:transcriptional regulator with XRE-family HTH domain
MRSSPKAPRATPGTEVAKRFGANLAYCRKRAKLSQEELSVRASLHRTAVGQLERAERVARIDTLVKLAGSLGVPPGDLLDGLDWEPGGTLVGSFALDSEDEGGA